jgi:hypothetical protein
MDAREAFRQLRRAQARLQRTPRARLRLVLDNDPPAIQANTLAGISTNHGVLTLHLHVESSTQCER